MVLACHETHSLHEPCYDNFIQHNNDNNRMKLCPLCRTPVDENAVVKRLLAPPDPVKVIDEVFGVDVPAEASA